MPTFMANFQAKRESVPKAFIETHIFYLALPLGTPKRVRPPLANKTKRMTFTHCTISHKCQRLLYGTLWFQHLFAFFIAKNLISFLYNEQGQS